MDVEKTIRNLDITTSGKEYWNLSREELIQIAIEREEGVLSQDGAFCVETGKYTGRVAKAKYTVVHPDTQNKIWYNEGNQKMTSDISEKILQKMKKYYANKDIFIRDCFVGANNKHRVVVRLITETAWHNAFGANMFLSFSEEEKKHSLSPELVIYHAPYFELDPSEMGTSSEAFVVSDLKNKIVMIGGTHYAGEIKKSVFSFMNYLLPSKGIISLHCSANVGKKGDVALFFGLSGTGKTTLSSEPSRALIGDDEHGWSDEGVFNIEGGCYAKMIRLSELAEPEIYSTIKKKGTILENVVLNKKTLEIDLDDDSITENTRGSYPLSHLSNLVPKHNGAHPQNIIMLTADAFGVLPPLSKLNKDQAIYHFLSGYTAKVAGTEMGIQEPTATFSACFGAPFMPLFPIKYAEILSKKIVKHEVNIYLVNTGWSGGAFQEGSRMPIKETRAMIRAILEKTLDHINWQKEPYFNLAIPESCPGVSSEILFPVNTWADKNKYEQTVLKLKTMFQNNFQQYKEQVSLEVLQAGF